MFIDIPNGFKIWVTENDETLSDWEMNEKLALDDKLILTCGVTLSHFTKPFWYYNGSKVDENNGWKLAHAILLGVA